MFNTTIERTPNSKQLLTGLAAVLACIVSLATAAQAAPEADKPAGAAGAAVLASPTTQPTALTNAKVALQAKQYAEAVKLLDTYLAIPDLGPAAAADEALYLKALALFYDGKSALAVEVADRVLKDFKDSPWAAKALFLKAQALIAAKDYKAAEQIFESEAFRLLGDKRKQDIAKVILQFADALATRPDPKDVGAPPANFSRAANLYRKVLAMEIGRDLKDDVMFKLARAVQSADAGTPGRQDAGTNAPQQSGQQSVQPANAAIADYQAYLAEFDPDWAGPVGSQARSLNQKKQNPQPAGKHTLIARFHLAESMLVAGQSVQARQELEDLQKAPNGKPDADRVDPADVSWLIVRTYQMPANVADLDKAVAAARAFLVKFIDNPHAVEAAWLIAETYRNYGRSDEAIAAYREFIDAKNYKLPKGDAATKKVELSRRDFVIPMDSNGPGGPHQMPILKSPAELADEWSKLALYNVAQIQFSQKKYDDAIKTWQSYVTRFPNGPQWSASQLDIINAEFQMAVDLLAAKKYPGARKQFDAFLEKHPLDTRVPQILFIFGQIQVAAAVKAEEDAKSKPAAKAGDSSIPANDPRGLFAVPGAEVVLIYRAAIDEWARLIQRFPQAEESSLALYRTGVIYEEKLHDLDKALESYRRLNWGSWAQHAAGRVAVMTRKSLSMNTERVFRTNEPAKLKLSTRNIDKLTVKIYWLDLESYFRKTHGIAAVEALDIALIQPDKTFEIKVPDYAKYKLLQPEIDLPFDAANPGVCIVNVSEEDLEATTLVMRSDIDLIVKSSRKEAIVFVQDMVKGTPAEGVDLLLSDGQKILATGAAKTGKDGVYRVKLDELKTVDTLRVLASRVSGPVDPTRVVPTTGNSARHIAANFVPLSGLSISAGLAPKGYLYTDRPTYKPGQPVFLRGIIRHAKDGAYVVPEGQVYVVSVTDPQGRLLWQEEKKLSQFGTFDGRMELDGAAPLGGYALTARLKDSKDATLTFSSGFQVQQFQTEKVKLTITLPQVAYFRGDAVEAEIVAAYYWGQPLADRMVRYTLPDGRQFAEKTDTTGKLKIKFDTTGMSPGSLLRFTASVEGENVTAIANAYLAVQAFTATVATNQPLVLAGEPVEVTVKTVGPDGKPLSADLVLTILRRQVVKPDPVLAATPGLRVNETPSGEVTVREVKLTTDAKTGIVKSSQTFEAGGIYILRVSGKDRFGQVVTAANSVQVSDQTDTTKLRFFADAASLKVGEKVAIKLHSRLDKGLALLTFEGEDVLEYRVVELNKDYNAVELAVGHEHFPNFTVAAAAIDGKLLQFASRPFTVERELKVTVKPLGTVPFSGKGTVPFSGRLEKGTVPLVAPGDSPEQRGQSPIPQKDAEMGTVPVFEPGAKGDVKLTVTDQLGKPVKAELSLSLVDQALLAIYPDNAQPILSFFQDGVWRQGEFRVASSAGWNYAGLTRAVPKVYMDEADRLARDEKERQQLQALRPRLAVVREINAPPDDADLVDQLLVSAGEDQGPQEEVTEQLNGADAATNGIATRGGRGGGGWNYRGAQPGRTPGNQPYLAVQRAQRQQQGFATYDPNGGIRNLGTGNIDNDSVLMNINAGDLTINGNGVLALTDGREPGGAGITRPRRDVPDAGFWVAAVVTDDKGEATVSVTMPETTSQWLITSKGCTVETLVGQATASVVTRKDFFVALKGPASVQAGDKVQFLARVHNMTDYAGPVELKLNYTMVGQLAKKPTGPDDHVYLGRGAIPRTVQIGKQATKEVLFDEYTVPADVGLMLTLSAKAGDKTDELTRAIDIRPYGLEYASQAGGTSTGDAQAVVQLPDKQEYTQRWMTVSIGPSLQRAVIEMALGTVPFSGSMEKGTVPLVLPPSPPTWGGLPGSDLLATVSALEYARAAKAPEADIRRLTDRAVALVGSLVVSQDASGAWLWLSARGAANTGHWAPTSMSLWALAKAKQAGLVVNADTINKAQAYLQNAFTALPATDNDARAVVLHALALVGAADFAHLNRLYRERNSLSDAALAYTALGLVQSSRNEMAKELLDLLLTKGHASAADGRKLINWEGVAAHPWLNDPIETTAVVLLALARCEPQSPRANEIAQFLLQQRGCYGYRLAKSNGPAVAALAAYFGIAKFAATEYKLAVLVNDKPVGEVQCRGDQPTIMLNVPAELIGAGKNRVDFRLNGKGEYAFAVTLRGFSVDLKDPDTLGSGRAPLRHYYHAPLEYRGRGLGVQSTSPVSNIEVGQRVDVHLELNNLYTGVVGRNVMVHEPLPAGTVYVEGSLTGNFVFSRATPSGITLYYAPGQHIGDVRYQVIGYATGTYRVLPTVARDAMDPARMRVGSAGDLVVLAPDEKSKDVYAMNDAERFAMGSALFNDGVYDEALKFLAELWQGSGFGGQGSGKMIPDARSPTPNSRPPTPDTRSPLPNERDLARMLLWIYTLPKYYDARQIVAMFEVLRERHPDLVIPFDKILAVGKAYRDIGEFERSCYVFRAAIDASYINDSNVSAVLSDEGQFLASVDFQEDLWREYPDSPDVVNSYFALSQLLYQKAPEAHLLANQERRIALARGRSTTAPDKLPNKIDMLKETLRMLANFMTLYPDNPLADDAAFSMANAFLALKQYPAVVAVSQTAADRFPKSEFASGFQYMTALGHFWLHENELALKAAELVAAGESKDRDLARYIVGQIYHAQGTPAKAIEWYKKVDTLYPDAKEAIGYFEEKRISLDEVSTFKPGEPVQLKLKYRNVKQAALQVYRVDLMKLYLREKNLANITKVNLSGIKPEAELDMALGDGKDYVDKETMVKLGIKDEAAYLVIARGDDLFTSAVVLISPLKIDVQEDPVSGRVRANVTDQAKSAYVAEVHVKAIGSSDSEFKSGQTDLRGIFVADGLRGKATVIARLGDSRYAFYRGEKWLGQPEASKSPAQPALKQLQDVQYDINLGGSNNDIQFKNSKQFDDFRRQSQKGVQVQKAK